MQASAYKCPSCGRGISFDPASGKFVCEYCSQVYTTQQLESYDNKKDTEYSQFGEYVCPNCGAQVITDATDAASFCYFCDSPVVFNSRISGEFKPDGIVPFKITKEFAQQKFDEMRKKKKFLPKDFGSDKKHSTIKGIYMPYRLVDSVTDGELVAQSNEVSVWTAGDIEYTETSTYQHVRQGEITSLGIAQFALKGEDKRLMSNVCPYNRDSVIPFNTSYLSGFFAEKNDITREEMQSEVDDKINKIARNQLAASISNSISRTENFRTDIRKEDWKYVLLPIWVSTYKYGDKIYTYAMNGESGKICGELPVSKGKLAGLFAGCAAAAGIIAGLITAFLTGGFML